MLDLPILRELAPGGLDYGKILLVEFEPQSLWYETSFTITAHAVKNGIRTQYHTFTHIPTDIRETLTKHGLDVKILEENQTLQIVDSYTTQTRLGNPDASPQMTPDQKLPTQSLKLSDWSIADAQAIKAPDEREVRWLHVDDNNSALTDYNDEGTILNYWKTRMIPGARRLQLAFVNALLVQVHSDSFYKRFEALCDGILDFRSRDDGNRLVHEARTRVIRGQTYESRWRRLQFIENEVRLAD